MIRKMLILFSIVCFVACSGKEKQSADTQDTGSAGVGVSTDKKTIEQTHIEEKNLAERIPVDIYYAYTMPRTVDSKAVENLMREIVREHFEKSDSVRYININIHDKQYKDILDKYDISDNTLIVTNGDTISDFTELALQKARSNPYLVIKEIKEEINRQAYP